MTTFIRAILIAGGAILTVGTAARADVVTEWNSAALDAIRADRTPPPLASRALAIVHVAIYDAVNGVVRSHEPFLVPSGVPASASIEAAASAAAHVTLEALFPALSERFDRLHAAILDTISDGPHKRTGIEWGERVARVILDSRVNDNADAIVAVPGGHAPGQWQPTPPAYAPYLLPQWGIVTPFAMPSSSFARPPGPPALDSARWVDDYNEIKALGAAVGSSRTPEQSLIALFWADGAGTETPPGHWNHIAQSVSVSRRTSVLDDARLFALLNIALADAGICAWDAKYVYDFWRPVTAIQQGGGDASAATVADGSWGSFIVTPPFPDYVSGHSAFSGAAATVLTAFFGTDEVGFTAESDALPGVERRFTSFHAAAAEAALSRLYGGIHFRSANEDGLAAGVEVGEWAVAHALLPKENRSRR